MDVAPLLVAGVVLGAVGDALLRAPAPPGLNSSCAKTRSMASCAKTPPKSDHLTFGGTFRRVPRDSGVKPVVLPAWSPI